MDNEFIDSVLNSVYDNWNWDRGSATIRCYLVELARQCWLQDEDFSGKRPFGNRDWKEDVYEALVYHGFITARYNEPDHNEIIETCFKRLAMDNE